MINTADEDTHNPLCVLVIDDYPDDRVLIKRALKREFPDVAVKEITDEESFSQALEEGGFDAVITDYHLQWNDGLNVLHRIRARHPECPVIMYTGTGNEEIAVEAMKAGLDDYVLKGANRISRLPSSLHRALEKVLERRKRKQAEEALKESEEKYRTVVEHAGEAIFIAQDEMLKFLNPATERLLGFPKGELSMVPFVEYIHPDDRGMVLERYRRRIRAEDVPTKYMFRVMDRNNEEHMVEITATATTWEGRPATLNFLRDITTEKKLEEQLRQAQKMEAIGVLAGGVAHDFNNLLTSIIGNADLALMDLKEDTSLYHYIEEIKKAGQRAASLTRQLLAFSRKQIVRPEVVDLNEVVKDTEKMLRRLIGEDIELETFYAQDPWQVYADPGQVDQVIMNLVVNARDAMPKGGKLTIETANVELDEAYFRDHGMEQPPGLYVMLGVSDTGIGMDKELQSRIFEPFFTTKEKGHGTGLGLSTVYGIVKKAGGYVWVYSEPGEGATFKVYLPRFEGAVSGEQPEETQPLELQGSETILLVEDDEMLRELTQSIIEQFGYQALVASNGDAALRISGTHEREIHLLLTDVVMPGMDGREVAEILQGQRPELKVLFMSGYTDNAIAHHGVLDAGMDFIQKPFSPKALAKKIRQVLEKEDNADHPDRRR